MGTRFPVIPMVMAFVSRAALLDQIVNEYRLSEPVYVTRPTMPALEEYTDYLRGIWERRWLTNDGVLHQELERRLCNYLGVEHLSLFCNGTIALLVALNALRINSGEVITTPFTFPATAHVLYWNGIRPVFCDIDEATFNLDPNSIERLIGPDTKAILAVHVYGTPCDVDAIQAIADRHGLRVIYDAAHGFGVKYRGRSILEYGDLSMLSFHATKLFTTIEGGALISRTAAQQHRINFLKNFGIAGEEEVIGPGINGKMDEFQAAFGLLHLRMVEEEMTRRQAVATIYRERLTRVPGLKLLRELADTAPAGTGYFRCSEAVISSHGSIFIRWSRVPLATPRCHPQTRPDCPQPSGPRAGCYVYRSMELWGAKPCTGSVMSSRLVTGLEPGCLWSRQPSRF